MCLTGTDLVITIPLTVYVLVSYFFVNPNSDINQPWRTWKISHPNFSKVNLIPASDWKSDSGLVSTVEFTRWSVVLVAIVFFGFFGFTRRGGPTVLRFPMWPGNVGSRPQTDVGRESEPVPEVLEFAQPQSQISVPETTLSIV